jgi:hypothetical protein
MNHAASCPCPECAAPRRESAQAELCAAPEMNIDARRRLALTHLYELRYQLADVAGTLAKTRDIVAAFNLHISHGALCQAIDHLETRYPELV